MRLDCSGMEYQKAFRCVIHHIHQTDIRWLFPLITNRQIQKFKLPLFQQICQLFKFHEAVLTGNYLPDYEGELSASLDKEETDNTDAEGEEKGRYILAVHQGDTVCTLFFKDISLECELYDYGEIGHFWVKGYEYLRQLEYKIAILGDKWEYLGEDCCSEEEKKLASLREFPPLSYLFYPAASLAYVREKEEPWKCSPLAENWWKRLQNRRKIPGLQKWYPCIKDTPSGYLPDTLPGCFTEKPIRE